MDYNDQEYEYLHDMGKLPERYYSQLNKRTPADNYIFQKRKILEEIENQKREKEIEEIEKEFEKQLYFALYQTMTESSQAMGEMAAEDVVGEINAMLGNGRPAPRRKLSFGEEMAAMLGRFLAEAPFKLLSDALHGTDKKRR